MLANPEIQTAPEALPRPGFGLAAGVATALLSTAAPDASLAAATPAATTIETMTDNTEALAFALAGRVDAANVVWLVFHCARNRDGLFSVHAHFGLHPPDRRPVQFGLRNPWGDTWHGGEAVVGGRSPDAVHAVVLQGDDALEVADRALVEGTLASNGWNSLWIRAPQDQLDAARDRIEGCRTNSER